MVKSRGVSIVAPTDVFTTAASLDGKLSPSPAPRSRLVGTSVLTTSQNSLVLDIAGDIARPLGAFDANGRFVRDKGLNWIVTSLFLIGDIAGGGLVSILFFKFSLLLTV